MNKIMVEIQVPVAQKSFELFLPIHLRGFEALKLITKLAATLTGGLFTASNETILERKEDGSILDLNLPIWKLQIKNGDKLVLI